MIQGQLALAITLRRNTRLTKILSQFSGWNVKFGIDNCNVVISYHDAVVAINSNHNIVYYPLPLFEERHSIQCVLNGWFGTAIYFQFLFLLQSKSQNRYRKRILNQLRLVATDCNPAHYSAMYIIVIECAMHGAAIVPDHYRAWRPTKTADKFIACYVLE